MVGQTLKRPLVTEHIVEVQKCDRPDNQSQNLKFGVGNVRLPKIINDQSNFFFLSLL